MDRATALRIDDEAGQNQHAGHSHHECAPSSSPETEGVGQRSDAENGRHMVAPPSPAIDDEAGHTNGANAGQIIGAPSSSPQLDDAEGHSSGASNGHQMIAPASSSEREGEGQTAGAGNGQTSLAPPSHVIAAMNVCLAKARGNVAFAATMWVRQVLMDSEMMRAWAIEALEERKRAQNGGGVGHIFGAAIGGHKVDAPSPLPNGAAEGLVTRAGDGHEGSAPAVPTEREGEGHAIPASNGHSECASPSPTNEDDEGHTNDASDGLINFAPSSSPDRDGEGQALRANDGHSTVAPPSLTTRDGEGLGEDASNGRSAFAVPAREPSPEAIALRGAARIERYATLWDKFEARHQVNLRKTRFSELYYLRDRGFELGYVADQIIRNHPFANPDTYLGFGNDRLLSDAELAEYVRTAEGRSKEHRH
jgi:hypothetical protein